MAENRLTIQELHPWNVTPKEAVAIQRTLRDRVVMVDRFPPIRHVAGVDVGYDKAADICWAAVVILRFPGLEVVEGVAAEAAPSFPYLPGLLSFREIPVVLRALRQLRTVPDLLLCDGQGSAHPRRLGIACHLGLLTGMAAIGVGKRRLTGTYEEPGKEKGCRTPLIDKGEVIGAVVRTRSGVKPVFVSPGHNISLDSAVRLTLQCVTRYRLPETTRAAHRYSQLFRKDTHS